MDFSIVEDGFISQQLDTWESILKIFSCMDPADRKSLEHRVAPYLEFRSEVVRFSNRFFAPSCRERCFDTGESACCLDVGILTYFSDLVVNALVSGPEEILMLMDMLRSPLRDDRCAYLGSQGCGWRIKPVNCEMFVCKDVIAQVMGFAGETHEQYQAIVRQADRFTWPAANTLFGQIEDLFWDAGVRSPYMYFKTRPVLHCTR